MRGDGPGTYFAYLSYSNQMPAGIKALIDRYNITVYDNDDDVGDFCSELESVPANSFDTEMSNTSFLVNISTNNNDDDDKCVQSPAQTTDKKRLKLPSLTRRLSKFGKRSSCDKTKTAVESGSACDSESVETASFTETSMTTVDEPHLQSPDACIALKDEDQDNQKNKYKEESAMRACKSSTEEVPLRAKPALNFQDAVFYYPSEQTADDDDIRRGLAHVLSEGRVPAASATVFCSSDEQLLLVKEAVSMQPGVGDDMPLIAASRHRPSVLRRMRAFFARSSSGNMAAGHDDMSRAGRQLSAADALMTTPPVWTDLDEAPSLSAAVGGVGVDDASFARQARSYTSPPTRYVDGGEWKPEHDTAATTKAAAGEQPCNVKNNSEQLMCSCKLNVSDTKP